MTVDNLLKGCSNPELFGPNSNEEKRIEFLRQVGLKPEPEIDDPDHFFNSEKEFQKSNKYYGYIKNEQGIYYKG